MLKAPTNIYIIARNAKLRIESAYVFERGVTKSHITTGNMFRLTVRQQNVNWIAGRMGDALSNEAIVRRRNVGAANSNMLRIHERARKVS